MSCRLERRGNNSLSFYKLFRFIPIEIEYFFPKAIEAVQQELNAGNTVCLMQPIELPEESLQEWEDTLQGIFQQTQGMILPIEITKLTPPSTLSRLSQLLALRNGTIRVSYGTSKKM